MDNGNSSDSGDELVIDETIVLSSSDEESCAVGKFKIPDKDKLSEKLLKVTNNEDNHWPSEDLFPNLFHPESISSSDMKDELLIEETNTCTICNESFKYNVALIYHIEMDHNQDINSRLVKQKKPRVAKKVNKQVKNSTSQDNEKSSNHLPGENLAGYSYNEDALEKLRETADTVTKENIKIPFKKSCDVCKKSFTDQNKMSKHVESCLKVGLKFHCIYCKSKFGWESKYKKHLFRTHKLNAAVICKLCSSVFSDMASLATHSKQCDKKQSVKRITDAQIPLETVANNISN